MQLGCWRVELGSQLVRTQYSLLAQQAPSEAQDLERLLKLVCALQILQFAPTCHPL